MRGVAETLEDHHCVRILDEAVQESVRLSMRYISGRQLPDKSVSLLDTACARVAMGHQETPPAVQDLRRRIDQTKLRISILEREDAASGENAASIAELEAQLESQASSLEALEQRWQEEADMVGELNELRAQLEGEKQTPAGPGAEPSPEAEAEAAAAGASDATEASTAVAEPPKVLSDEERAELRQKFKEVSDKLREHQGEEPLIQPASTARRLPRSSLPGRASLRAGWSATRSTPF